MNPAAPPAAPGDRNRWLSIQYLRGLAACGVVVFHYLDGALAPPGRHFRLGAYGVDLFFVISGFIMFTVARSEPVGRFLDRRLTRIYPLYWIATLLQVVTYWMVEHTHPSGTEMVKSLALWPHFSEAHRSEIWPVLVPGWSLSYELYFYGLFAIGLLCRRPVLVPTGLIVLAIAAGLWAAPQSAVLRVATNWQLGEFVCGLVIGAAVARDKRWLVPIAGAFFATAVACLATGHARLAFASAAALIVALAVFLEAAVRCPDWRWLRVTGDASYSIYLFHTPIYLLIMLFALPALPAVVPTWPFAIVAVCGTLALCIVLHFALERPLLRFTHRVSRRLGALVASRPPDATGLPPGASPR